MTEQEQIEEIKQVLIKTCKRCRTFEEDYMQSNYAKALYNANYRKADEIRKETAREILQYIGNFHDDCDERFQLKDYQWHKNLCKKYGVEENEQ